MEGIAPEEPDFDPNIDVSKYNFNFTPEQMGIDALYCMPNDFKSNQEESDTDGNTPKPFADFETLLNSNLSDEELEELEKANLMALEESKKKLQLAKCETTDLKHALPSGQPRHPAAYAANRELYHVADDAKTFTDHSEIIKDAVVSETDRVCQEPKSSMNTAQDSKLQEVTGAVASEDKTKQSRYTVAVQKANGKHSVRKRYCSIPFLYWNPLR